MPSLLGCEDIIAESISLDTLIAILKWSSHPYGSKWVHRQALHFLCEELSQVMTSDVFYELSKDHLLTAIQSDYLQVIIYTPLKIIVIHMCTKNSSVPCYSSIGRGAGYDQTTQECPLDICTVEVLCHLSSYIRRA